LVVHDVDSILIELFGSWFLPYWLFWKGLRFRKAIPTALGSKKLDFTTSFITAVPETACYSLE
jgi:hypothetical protein